MNLSPYGFLIIVFTTVAASVPAEAQKHWKVMPPFERHPFYVPLAAEPRSAQTKVLFPGRASSVPFSQKPGQSLVWDISVGDEIPIAGFANTTDLPEGRPVPVGRFAISVSFPLSFHMVEDMGKDESNPILNTDYRFGLMIKAQFGLPDWRAITKPHIGIRYVPIAHESTHLGDEFTLHATQQYGNAFRRVNVSYQYWELGGSFEPNLLTDGRLELKFRGGVIHEAFNKNKGWYSAELIQPVGGTVPPSHRNYEPYFGFEGFLSDWPGESWGPVLSVDVRNRTIYGYDRPARITPEDTQLSYNILAGFRHRRSGPIEPSYYFRYYHGVNPAGQFRSQRNYQLYGIEVQFRF